MLVSTVVTIPDTFWVFFSPDFGFKMKEMYDRTDNLFLDHEPNGIAFLVRYQTNIVNTIVLFSIRKGEEIFPLERERKSYSFQLENKRKKRTAFNQKGG